MSLQVLTSSDGNQWLYLMVEKQKRDYAHGGEDGGTQLALRVLLGKLTQS